MKNFFLSKSSFLIVFILAALVVRLYGLNWDQGQHLHPDERFLTMVTEAVAWPSSVSFYLHPNISSLNPYNAGYPFFVYGMFPLILVKLFSGIVTLDRFPYNNITLVGRVASAMIDSGTQLVVFLIARRVFSLRVALVASLFYGISVLPIQLSHFFAVDSFMVFFLTLAFLFLLVLLDGRRALAASVLLGIAFGLALACKVSVVVFLPVVGLGFSYSLVRKRAVFPMVLGAVLFLFFAYTTLRLADPRVFASASFFDPRPNPQFSANLRELGKLNTPQTSYPPAIQWIPTQPLWFPLKNMVLWGFGLPLGILVVGGVVSSLRFFSDRTLLPRRLPSVFRLSAKHVGHFLILLWVLFFFLYQGTSFVKAMRYFYPIYPFLVILAARFFDNVVISRFSNRFVFGYWVLLLIFPLSFLSVYSRPHSRVLASNWIYSNIPAGSVLSCEHWDDCLPLSVGGKSSAVYSVELLPLFDPDSLEKWQKINRQLEQLDYLILSSDRLWGSIPKLPEKYPLTSQFYADLFAGKLRFQKVTTITSYPTIPFFNIPIPDDSSDESFTVYDHPQVVIFQKIR